VSKENEISLIVKSDNSSSFEFRVLGEERGKESANFDTDFGVKIIEDEFRDVLSGDCMMFDLFLEL
jgi:hypothetical protein